MDETLIQSKDVVVKLYKELGVDMPEDAWGKPWREWLPEAMGMPEFEAEFLHTEKTARMLKEDLRWLPMVDVIVDAVINRQIPWGIMTGASRQMLYRISIELQNIVQIPPGVMVAEARIHEKREVLLRVSMSRPDIRICYVDDDLEMGREIVKGTNAFLVHYTGQNASELMEEIWTP